MTKLTECTNEERRLLRNMEEKYHNYLTSRGILTDLAEAFIQGYRSRSGVSSEAKMLLDATVAYEFSSPMEGESTYATFWKARETYKSTLVPPVDIKALEREVERTKTILADHVALLGHNHKTEEKFAADYREARTALEKAKAPKPKTELELAQEVATRLRGYIGYHRYDFLNDDWRAVVEALEEWEKAR